MKLIIIIFAISTTVSAQSPVDLHFESKKSKKKTSNIPDSLFFEHNLKSTIKDISKYEKDTNLNFAFDIAPLLVRAALSSNNSQIRIEIVSKLIDLGISNNYCQKKLFLFEKNDFDDGALEKIKNYIESNVCTKELYFLTAKLDMKGLLPFYSRIAYDKKNPLKHRWNILLTMVLLKDLGAERTVVEIVENQKFDENFIYEMLPDLLFCNGTMIKNRVLKMMAESKDYCFSPNPDSDTKIPCACLALPVFAKYLEDFPLQLNSSGDLIEKNCQLAIRKFELWYEKQR